MKMLARTGAKGETMDLIIKLTVKSKMSLRCSKKENFLSSFLLIFRL